MEENKNEPQENEINLLDYLIVILKHKEFIIKLQKRNQSLGS